MDKLQVKVDKDGVYDCNIPINVDDWKEILQTVEKKEFLGAIEKFYFEHNHAATCKALGDKYGIEPQSINSLITHFAKSVQKKLNRFEILDTDGSPTFWIIVMTGKKNGNFFEWTLRPEIVDAIEQLNLFEIKPVTMEIKEQEYTQFKKILEYFVAHLEWLVNEDVSHPGYQTYIKPLLNSENFKKTGRGYEDAAIQKAISQLDSFSCGQLCITVEYKYGNIKTKASYLNWKHTDVNVAAEWANDRIVALNQYIYDNGSKPFKAKDLDKRKTIAELGLYKEGISDELKEFFQAYVKALEIYEEGETVTEAQQDNKQEEEPYKGPLNQILFGPPGTGKTYNSINEALEITGFATKGKTRKDIKDEFDKKLKEGQIVFTTFHQSMSYEEFIEGIKPVEPEKEGEDVLYRVEPGIFKRLCQNASTPNAESFEDSYNALVKMLSDTGSLIDLKTPTGKDFSISINSKGNLNLHTGKERTKQGTLTKYNIQKQIFGEDKFVGWEGYFKGVINLLQKEYALSIEAKELKNYVLIIDEINRGNVSQIFGELITLIEEDKRQGKPEALKVTLPYSKEPFSVPPNLYIIGTMNTADRSVEALDTALRRRFSFTEMPPLYHLDGLQYDYADTTGKDILQTINKRIEKLLDRDHLIGHSYFLIKDGQEPKTKLIDSFYRNIIPLLQEYFFGDYAKIGAVLGKGFVKAKEQSNEQNLFADFDEFDAADFSEKPVYEIVDYRNAGTIHTIKKKGNDIKMDFEKAIQELMGKLS